MSPPTEAVAVEGDLPLAAVSQAEAAHTSLLELVVTLGLRPGTQVSEQDLSRHTGYGRTPVREAVQRLAREGFVSILPRRGVLVSPLDLNHQLEVWEFRMAIEPEAARLAAGRASDDDIARLDAALRGSTSDEAGTSSIDEQLHLEIARASGNDLFIRHTAVLYGHAKRLWLYQNRRGWRPGREVVNEWAEIVEAIGTRDGDTAFRRMRDHVRNARTSLAFGL